MKKLIFKIKVWWFWIGQFRSDRYPTSEAWSKILQELIDKGEIFTDISEFTAKLGQYTIWIANCPYASFHEYGSIFKPKVKGYMPNKVVGYNLTNLLKKSIEIQKQNELNDYEKKLNNERI